MNFEKIIIRRSPYRRMGGGSMCSKRPKSEKAKARRRYWLDDLGTWDIPEGGKKHYTRNRQTEETDKVLERERVLEARKEKLLDKNKGMNYDLGSLYKNRRDKFNHSSGVIVGNQKSDRRGVLRNPLRKGELPTDYIHDQVDDHEVNFDDIFYDSSECIDRSNCEPDEVCIEEKCIKEEVIRQRNLHNLRPLTIEECSALINKEVIFRTGIKGTYTAQTVTILDCPEPLILPMEPWDEDSLHFSTTPRGRVLRNPQAPTLTPGTITGWRNARTCTEDEDILVRYGDSGDSNESCTHISYLFHKGLPKTSFIPIPMVSQEDKFNRQREAFIINDRSKQRERERVRERERERERERRREREREQKKYLMWVKQRRP